MTAAPGLVSRCHLGQHSLRRSVGAAVSPARIIICGDALRNTLSGEDDNKPHGDKGDFFCTERSLSYPSADRQALRDFSLMVVCASSCCSRDDTLLYCVLLVTLKIYIFHL